MDFTAKIGFSQISDTASEKKRLGNAAFAGESP
jgi:hypothetical protein